MTPLVLALLIAPPAEPVRVPYRLTDTKHVLVRLKLNSKGPFNFILDTGAPAVFIPQKLATTLGVTPGDDGWATFDRFEVEGGLVVPAVKTRVEDLFQLEGMNGLGLAGVELHGVVGYNVLAQFRITYDFSADALRWVPLTGFTPPALSGGRGGGGQGGLEILGPVMKVFGALMGISANFETKPRGFLGFTAVERDGGVVALAVLPDSPAAAAGLRVGDRIVTATGTSGKPRDIETLADLTRRTADLPAGASLTLTVNRGDATATLSMTAGKGL